MAPTRNARQSSARSQRVGRRARSSAHHPDRLPIPGRTVVYDTSQTIDLENVPLRGGILLKTLVLSVDPYMRGRMNTHVKSYSPAFQLGQPLENYGVGIVVRSENPAFNTGDHVYGIFLEGFTRIKNNHGIPWSVFVGAAGMPGQTAYCGWKEYAHAKKGEVAFISTGAGAAGSLIIQLAKRDSLKVIFLGRPDEKVAFMKELGADMAFNYKTTKTTEVLEKEGPIDAYWDNVGGETLEAALGAAAKHARFIECEMISGYNTQPYPVMNLVNIVRREIKVYGFLVNSILARYRDAFYAEVPALIASGGFMLKEDLAKGLESVGEAILAVQKGTNTGKSVIVVTVGMDYRWI